MRSLILSLLALAAIACSKQENNYTVEPITEEDIEMSAEPSAAKVVLEQKYQKVVDAFLAHKDSLAILGTYFYPIELGKHHASYGSRVGHTLNFEFDKTNQVVEISGKNPKRSTFTFNNPVKTETSGYDASTQTHYTHSTTTFEPVTNEQFSEAWQRLFSYWEFLSDKEVTEAVQALNDGADFVFFEGTTAAVSYRFVGAGWEVPGDVWAYPFSTGYQDDGQLRLWFSGNVDENPIKDKWVQRKGETKDEFFYRVLWTLWQHWAINQGIFNS